MRILAAPAAAAAVLCSIHLHSTAHTHRSKWAEMSRKKCKQLQFSLFLNSAKFRMCFCRQGLQKMFQTRNSIVGKSGKIQNSKHCFNFFRPSLPFSFYISTLIYFWTHGLIWPCLKFKVFAHCSCTYG